VPTDNGGMAAGPGTAGTVRLDAATRPLRRILRPIEWVVLEDVALDARRDAAGALVASTSARRVAEHLGLTPGAVARALARLRSEGLVTHVRQPGDAGRFGLSAYVLAPVPGLDVVDAPRAPDGAGPDAAAPRAVPPHVKRPGVGDAHVAGAGVGGGADRRDARTRRSDDRPGGAPADVAHPVAAGRSGHDGGRSARRHDRAQPPPAAQLSILDADPLRPSP
jgi:DNA-binding transcriptional ArsR family regulator